MARMAEQEITGDFMSGKLVCVTNTQEALDVVAERGAFHMKGGSDLREMLKHVATGGTAVALGEHLTTGFRLPEGSTIEFSKSFMKSGMMRDQIQARAPFDNSVEGFQRNTDRSFRASQHHDQSESRMGREAAPIIVDLMAPGAELDAKILANLASKREQNISPIDKLGEPKQIGLTATPIDTPDHRGKRDKEGFYPHQLKMIEQVKKMTPEDWDRVKMFGYAGASRPGPSGKTSMALEVSKAHLEANPKGTEIITPKRLFPTVEPVKNPFASEMRKMFDFTSGAKTTETKIPDEDPNP
jgi:hypothetical protein